MINRVSSNYKTLSETTFSPSSEWEFYYVRNMDSYNVVFMFSRATGKYQISRFVGDTVHTVKRGSMHKDWEIYPVSNTVYSDAYSVFLYDRDIGNDATGVFWGNRDE